MGLFGSVRREVCLLSPASDALKNALAYRNLQPSETTTEVAITRCRGPARAVVSLSKPLDLSKHLAAILRPALENGVAFVAVDIEKDEFAQVPRMCGSEALSQRLNIPPRDADDAKLLRVQAFDITPDWEQRVAQYCADNDPGRSFDGECKVDSSGLPQGTNFPDDEDIFLIGRAFNECSSVKLKHLARGHSRAKGPWIIDAQSRDGRSPVTFVMKTGPLGEIKKEIDVMQEACFNHIPFRHYPPVAPDRCVTGATKRAIVSMLVENAMTFEQYLRNQTPGNKIAEILGGPLKLWRKVQSIEEVNMGQLYQARGVTPKEAWHMKKIWAATQENDAQVLKHNELYERFMSHDKVSAQYVQAHGDLHLRNILIHETGEVLLIDFSESDRLPASYDPATLDVALAFDIPDQLAAEASVSDAQRLELYSLPLLEGRATDDPNFRIAGVLVLRNQIRESVSEIEYELAIAARLMWWARWRKSQLAYRCASRIVNSFSPGAP